LKDLRDSDERAKKEFLTS